MDTKAVDRPQCAAFVPVPLFEGVGDLIPSGTGDSQGAPAPIEDRCGRRYIDRWRFGALSLAISSRFAKNS